MKGKRKRKPKQEKRRVEEDKKKTDY